VSTPAAATPAAPPRTGGAFGVVSAFVARDFKVALSYRLSFVLDGFSTLFQILLFFFLSSLFDQAGFSGFAGLRQGYFAFAIVGLIMMRIIDVSLRTFAETMRGEQVLGTFEALMALPTSLSVVVLGSGTYNLLYGITVGGFMFGLALLLGAPFAISPLGAVIVLIAFVATLAFFTSVGILVAAVIVVFKQGMGLIGVVTQFLSLLGGVYFPVTVFPAPIQAVAELLPFTWSLQILRGALLDGTLLWQRLGWLAAVAALSVPLSLWLLRVAVDHARGKGTLAQY
jgi:ABC-2 type transport system permease protein